MRHGEPQINAITKIFIGHIVEIISSSNSLTATVGIVTFEKFIVGSEQHHYPGIWKLECQFCSLHRPSTKRVPASINHH
jgi:hypothetical protein